MPCDDDLLFDFARRLYDAHRIASRPLPEEPIEQFAIEKVMDKCVDKSEDAKRQRNVYKDAPYKKRYRGPPTKSDTADSI